MKNLKEISKLFSILIFLSLVWMALFAGDGTWTTNASKTPMYPGEILTFSVSFDTTGKDTSNNFTIGKYDHVNLSSYPFRCELKVTCADTDTVRGNIYVDGSFDATNWHAVDTIKYSIMGTARLDTTISFNNLKYPRYRQRFENDMGADTTVAIVEKLWLYQENQ